jgi:hypothetical protein
MKSSAVTTSASGSRDASVVARNVGFVLLGVAALLLKARYAGPHLELVHSYGGNISASFAVYFILANPLSRRPGLKFRNTLTAALALAVVELFEATDGFHVMSNTYDPADYLANTIGIALALLADAVIPGPKPAAQ